MILFSNDCSAGFIYRNILNEEYSSPTIWTRINIDDFIILIKSFNTINFKNYELHKQTKNLDTFYIRIDNKINIYFNHYKFNKDDNILRKAKSHFGIDVYYNKIWEYIIEKYDKHINKMFNNFSNPIFILHIDSWYNDFSNSLNLNKIYDLINYCKEKKIKLLVLTEKYINKDIPQIIVSHKWAEEIQTNLHDEILKKLNKIEKD